MISSSSTPLDMIADFHRRDHLFVTVCYAQTLDGSISTESGETLLISGPESMRLTHQLRAVHDGILVGVNTVLADNPRLNVRLELLRNQQFYLIFSDRHSVELLQ